MTTVRLYTLSGAKVFSGKLKGPGVFSLNVKNGVYLLEMGRVSKTLIVPHILQ